MKSRILHLGAASAVLISAATAQIEADGAANPQVAPHVLQPEFTPESMPDEADDDAAALAAFPADRAQRIDALMYTDDVDELWVRGRTYKAGATAEGFTYVPYLGSEASRIYPIQFTLGAATQGGEPIQLRDRAAISRDKSRFTLDRGPIDVLYEAELESVEQLFVIENPARSGEIVLSIEVDTDLEVSPDGGGFRFSGPEGGASYSAAIAFDEAGARTDVAAAYVDGQIQLTVPASFVASARGAITVDPVAQTFPINLATDRQFLRPDVSYDSSNAEFLYAYEEQFAVGDRDILATRTDATGAFLGNDGIIVGTRDVADPSVANVNGQNACLIVCSRAPLVGSEWAIVGKIFVMDTSLVGGLITISNNEHNTKPDVGGTFSSDPGGVFLVGWTKEFNDGDQKARIRSVAPSGTLGTLFAYDFGVEDVFQDEVVIGKSTGDPSDVNFWPVVVRSEDRNTGDIDILARRWNVSGATILSSVGTLRTFTSGDVVNLDVSSGLETPLAASTSLQATYVVAYTRDTGSPDETFLIVCRNNASIGIPYPLQQLEHAPDDLFYRNPRLGVAFDSYVVSYQEDQPGLNLNHEVYLSTFKIIEEGAIGIGERRVSIGDTTALFAGGAAIATRYDAGTPSRLSALTWSRFESVTGNSSWNVRGATHLANLFNVFGAQYCYGTENTTGDRGFLTIIGDNDVTSTKTALASALPPQQFTLLAVGTVPAQVFPVPNSVGTICIGGSLGRFNGQVNQVGLDGNVSYTIDPTMMPTPNAIVPAIAGQIRVFQVWHRDFDNGASSSNFTNAVAVRFR